MVINKISDSTIVIIILNQIYKSADCFAMDMKHRSIRLMASKSLKIMQQQQQQQKENSCQIHWR